MKQNIKEFERIQEMYDGYVLSKTNILKDKLTEIKNMKLEWYISADEALKLGIAEEII
jgi:ATP-dependent Clp protease protease subunit